MDNPENTYYTEIIATLDKIRQDGSHNKVDTIRNIINQLKNLSTTSNIGPLFLRKTNKNKMLSEAIINLEYFRDDYDPIFLVLTILYLEEFIKQD